MSLERLILVTMEADVRNSTHGAINPTSYLTWDLHERVRFSKGFRIMIPFHPICTALYAIGKAAAFEPSEDYEGREIL